MAVTAIGPADLAAARIALLAARTAVEAGSAVAITGYAVTAGAEPVSEDEAVRSLAALAKPLVCSPELHAGILALRCEPPRPAQAEAYSHQRAYWEGQGGYYGHLRARFGDEYRGRKVLCVGDDQLLDATIGDLEVYNRDYHVLAGGSVGDVPGSVWANYQKLTRPARERGAEYIIKFFPPDPNEGFAVVWVDDESAAAERGGTGRRCERCGERPAVRVVNRYTNEAFVRQHLCEECTAAEIEIPAPGVEAYFQLLEVVEQAEPEDRRELLAQLEPWVREMEQVWQATRTPAELERFFRRWRELHDGGNDSIPTGA